MRASFLCLAFVSCLGLLHAQGPPDIEWQRCLGGTGLDREGGVLELPNGELLLTVNPTAGGGNVPGPVQVGGDVWLLRLSQTATILQQRLIGGPGVDGGGQLFQAADGGYFMLGGTTANGGDVSGHHGENDLWLVKLDAGLNILWQRCYGGSGNEYGKLISAADGGFFLVGATQSEDGDVPLNRGNFDAWAMRISESGTVLWSRTYGGTTDDRFRSAMLNSEGQLICVGYSWSADGDIASNDGLADAWIARIDQSNGDLIEYVLFGGTGYESANEVIITPNGDLLIAGVTDTNDGDFTGYNGGVGDAFLSRFSSNLNLIWAKCFGGSSAEEFNDIIPGPDGGVVCAGFTGSNNGDVIGNQGDADLWITGINGNGDLLWQHCYGGAGNDRCYSVQRVQDQGLVAMGTTNSPNGDVSGFNGGFSDAWVVRLSEETVGVLEQRSEQRLFRYPNPCTDLLQVVNPSPTGALLPWRITDAQGRTVLTGTLSGSLGQVPVATLATGPYTVGLEWNGQWVTAPFVKE
ncbi:MAG: T9SS type A sorting domain-containing protein [Flavobacteriales bacterium]